MHAPPTATKHAGQRLGIRDTILMAMDIIGKPVKPADVTRHLEGRGYVHEGKTLLKTVVSNRMGEMRRSGLLEKNREGFYYLMK